MIDNRKNPWYYIIPLVLGFMIGGTAGWLLGNHPVAGGFLGWALATALFLWKGGPTKPSTTLNSFILPALLLVQLPINNYQLAIAIGLLILAYVAKAAIDTLTHQAGNNIFERWGKWFDTRTSWLNKYKPGSWEAGAPVPRFLGSTTVFAWATDFWHAADSVYLTSYLLGAMLLGAWLGPVQAWPWVLVVVLVKGGGGGVFQGCYRLFRIK
ncbi:MAG: hypothetical protein ACRYFZ_02475 [Janthinobacterium lividum]